MTKYRVLDKPFSEAQPGDLVRDSSGDVWVIDCLKVKYATLWLRSSGGGDRTIRRDCEGFEVVQPISEPVVTHRYLQVLLDKFGGCLSTALYEKQPRIDKGESGFTVKLTFTDYIRTGEELVPALRG